MWPVGGLAQTESDNDGSNDDKDRSDETVEHRRYGGIWGELTIQM